MKLTTAVLLVAVFQAIALQNGCTRRSPAAPSQASPTSVNQSQDKELLTNVEQFAAGGSDSRSAWQYLTTYNRQKLVADLTRISNSLSRDDRNRVLIAFTLCKLRYDYDHNRGVVLSALSRTSPYRDLHGDWVVTMIGQMVADGDKDLLGSLFAASEWSDGAMSTDLASAYSEALMMDPNNFLNVLSAQSPAIRKSAIFLLRDNSLTEEQRQKIESYLKGVVPPSKLAPVAAQTLKALSN